MLLKILSNLPFLTEFLEAGDPATKKNHTEEIIVSKLNSN